jgi:penicillin-binding protein 1A
MRQPGSSFKPFVYASALAAGIPASRVIADRPYVYEQVSGELWTPENFSGTFEGDMTLRQAFRTSTNTVAIRLADEVGLESVAQLARRLGVSTDIPRVPSIAIGSAEVLPIDMMGAYSAFANLGVRSEPFPILRVETADGEVVWEPIPERTEVLDPLVARAMVSLMEDVVARGTGASIRGVIGLPYDIPAAGKTGTTNESTDVWFNGFTPNLQATVWFGLDQPQPLYAGATSGEATPVWGEFMRMVYVGSLVGDDEAAVPPVAEGDAAQATLAQADLAQVDADLTRSYRPGRALLPVPDPWPTEGLLALEVDAQTGLLASRWCPADRRYLEFYIPGTEPSEQCDDTARGPSRFQFPF